MANRYTVAEVGGFLIAWEGGAAYGRQPGLSAHVLSPGYPDVVATFRSEDFPMNLGQAKRVARARAAAEADCARRNAEYEAWLAEGAA